MTKKTVGANGIRPVRQRFIRSISGQSGDRWWWGDRFWGRSVLGDSLASRVNAIDPYGFLRYTETQSRS